MPLPSFQNLKIGWIGTGVMGRSMFGHLLDKGCKGYVYNRTKEKALGMIEKGAQWCNGPDEIAANADIIFTMVGFPSDVRDVYLKPEGLINNAAKGSYLIDMTTTSPSLEIEIYEKSKSRGVYFIDAPVSGGDVGARNATLSIMAGGDKDAYEHVFPLFELMGRKIIYQGNAGSGQHTKMCNQIQIAGTMIGMCESLLYGYKAGLNPETMLSSISGGAAACWSIDNLAPRILKRDFEPGFFVRHFIKDMGIALEEAERLNISLPGLALVKQLYQSVSANGFAEKGTQALILALENLAGMNKKP
jgi:3-hydroxyisobutyrate dehydrogenase